MTFVMFVLLLLALPRVGFRLIFLRSPNIAILVASSSQQRSLN